MPDEEIGVKQAAEVLGVRASTLSSVLANGAVPFPARKAKGRWLILSAGLADALFGSCACPLVQAALAGCDGTAAPGGRLIALAGGSVPALRHAVSEAYGGVVLCRSARDAERRRMWQRAHALLGVAWRQADRVGLPAPTATDFDGLAVSIEAHTNLTVEIGTTVGPELRNRIDNESLDMIAASATVRLYISHVLTRSKSSAPPEFETLVGTVELGDDGENQRWYGLQLDGEQVARILQEVGGPTSSLPDAQRAAAHAVAEWARSDQ